DERALGVLRLLALFDRPADGEAVAAVRAPPVIPGLSDALVGVSEREGEQTVSQVRRAGLLAGKNPNQTDALDMHPLVREHFRSRLRGTSAWTEGHDRLYEHFTRTAEPHPQTTAGMSRLYAAVAHGCQAGRRQQALDDVYRPRVLRGEDYF